MSRLIFGATIVPPTCPCGAPVQYRETLCEGCLRLRELASIANKIRWHFAQVEELGTRRDLIKEDQREAAELAGRVTP